MIEYLLILLNFFWYLFLSIVFHELGHLFYMRRLYPKRRIRIYTYFESIRSLGFRVGKQKDYDQMTNREYFMSNFAGVSSGLLFIAAGTLLIEPYISYLVVPYLFGSLHDIKEMYKAYKEGL